ncbi:MAG: hypothetical protein II366_00605 [Clostridia bacterium]|nr:hypothetical protein [Clostridia bacterium]
MYIDFHSHILPAADHGSQSVEQSIELLEVAYDVGIRTVVALRTFILRSVNPLRVSWNAVKMPIINSDVRSIITKL